MTVTLEAIAATLQALKEQNQQDHERILMQLDKLNGTTRQNCDDITRLKEQQSVRTGALGIFTLIASVIAGWLGMQK